MRDAGEIIHDVAILGINLRQEAERLTKDPPSGGPRSRQVWDEMCDAFPDLGLQVDEVYWMGNDFDGWLISTRWSAEGTHEGSALYREPTGAACQIWGITQWQVKHGKVRKEWQLFNELDLIIQVAAARG